MTVKERFDKKVEMIPDGCWVWMARCDRDGYGRIRGRNGMIRAHRASWEFLNGPIPSGMHVLHSCDNPCCVNPNHLFLGNQIINMKDKVTKNRMAAGEQHGRSKLTLDVVTKIRADKRTHVQIAKDYGLSQGHVSEIKNGKYWKETL